MSVDLDALAADLRSIEDKVVEEDAREKRFEERMDGFLQTFDEQIERVVDASLAKTLPKLDAQGTNWGSIAFLTAVLFLGVTMLAVVVGVVWLKLDTPNVAIPDALIALGAGAAGGLAGLLSSPKK
jgi:hypothetical protein